MKSGEFSLYAAVILSITISVTSCILSELCHNSLNVFKNFNDKGYVSLYHQNKNINIGEEVDVTYRHTSGACFMLDYVLISASCVDSVGLTTDFSNSKDLLQSGFSDHIPIIFEV